MTWKDYSTSGFDIFLLISLQSRGRWLLEGVDVLLMDIIKWDGMGLGWSFAGRRSSPVLSLRNERAIFGERVLGVEPGICSTNFNELIHAPNRLLLAVYTDDLNIARPLMLSLRCWFSKLTFFHRARPTRGFPSLFHSVEFISRRLVAVQCAC
jgi:hypothetical protein